MPKEIHLLDLPENSIFISLKDEFRKQFFGVLTKKIGGQRELARQTGVFHGTIWKMVHGKRFRDKNKKIETVRIRLSLLKRFCKIYSECLGTSEMDVMKVVEKNIASYSAHSGTRVFNPILPIKQEPRVFRIIGHMIGDGTWAYGNGPKFINTSPELRTCLIRDLKKIFGGVEIKEVFYTNRTPIVTFPSAIIYVLNHVYGTKFSGIVGLPQFVSELTKEEKAYFLQALYDDEGYVHDSNVQICSRDKGLLLGLKEILLKDFNIETSPLSRYLDYKKADGSISRVFYFNIYSKSLENFSKHIGFQHPKKAEGLDWLLRKQKRKKIPSKNKIRKIVITELNKNGKMTAPQLAIKVLITARNLRKHLRNFEKEGMIEMAGKKKGKGGAQLWKLKNR